MAKYRIVQDITHQCLYSIDVNRGFSWLPIWWPVGLCTSLEKAREAVKRHQAYGDGRVIEEIS